MRNKKRFFSGFLAALMLLSVGLPVLADLILYRAVQRVQRSVDAFQRPLFQKGAAKLDFIDLFAVVPVRP